jgi:CBS-domain-containing membrane protein
VVSVRADASFKEMAAGLREHHVSAFPVVDDDGMLIGVVSEADMLPKKALEEEASGYPGWSWGSCSAAIRRRRVPSSRPA